ncbi:uncharacterized protein LOC125680492 isoform X2 [Ostrea edulis]|nr:uncharacterized protein LOC125680492 isoform X2 [Ostrea edulis]
MSVSVNSLDWECIVQSDRTYLFRSTETSFVFGGNIRGFICLEFWRVSATKYYYFHKTAISSTNQDHVLGRFDDSIPTTEEACTESYNSSYFITITKDGSVEDGSSEATCATDLLNEFSLVTISQHDDSSSCENNTMDGCFSKTQMSFSYHSSCTANHKFSVGGFWTCLRSITSNGYTYVSLWNNDTAVTSSYINPYQYTTGQTYRVACLVVKGTNATLFPKMCSDSTQTPSSVSSPGLKLTFAGAASSCYVTTEDGSDVVYYVIMIIGPLFIISLVILLIILHKRGICKKCKRKISKSNTVGSQEIIMAPPPEKIVPLYFDDPIQREKTDVISVFEFNTT